MYALDITSEVYKIFEKLEKKSSKQSDIVKKKIENIRENPYHEYKYLKKPLQKYQRVHIDKHFVLIFKINHENKCVELYFYGHHDEVYKWSPH